MRRQIMRYQLLSFASLGLVTVAGLLAVEGCTQFQTPGPSPADTDARIATATESLVALRVAEPSLPGFRFADSISANALRGRSRADAELLLARAYYDLSQGLARHPGISTDRAAVRAMLVTSRPAARYSAAYYDRLLTDTQRRIATDPAYHNLIQQTSNSAAAHWVQSWGDVKCYIDDMEWPPSACRTLLLNSWYSAWFF